MTKVIQICRLYVYALYLELDLNASNQGICDAQTKYI